MQRIEGFIAQANTLPRDSKAESLLDTLRVIREHGQQGLGSGKVVIFTESIRTQDSLFDLLVQNGFEPGEVTLFRGDNEHPRSGKHTTAGCRRSDSTFRSRIVPAGRSACVSRSFMNSERGRASLSRRKPRKGLNLQFCETLINYDLPWNPQRIEQRIGRVHRYGQRRGVTVLNFLDRGNEAQRLTFDILSQKLDLFGKVLDASDVVLHEPTTDSPEPLVGGIGVEFESQLRQIYRDARSIEDVTEQLQELREKMEARRREFDDEQARTAELIETQLDDSVRQVFSRWQKELPAGLAELDRDLDHLLSGYLQAVGIKYERIESAGRIHFQIRADVRLPAAYKNGVSVFVGPPTDDIDAEHFQPTHPLFAAAIAEARAATANTRHVVWQIPNDASAATETEGPKGTAHRHKGGVPRLRADG